MYSYYNMIDPELNSLVDDFNQKYKILLEKQKALKNVNNKVMMNAKKFLMLKKSDKVMVSNDGQALITKDGMMVSKVSGGNIGTSNYQDSYCAIDQQFNGDLPISVNTFNSSTNDIIYNGGNTFQYDTEIPCKYFNDLVQPGLDNFQYGSTSFSDVNCKKTDSSLPDPTINFNGKCKQNHFEICQSMAKLRRNENKNANYFGIVEDNENDQCYCYIGNDDTKFGTTIQPTNQTHEIISENSQMVALMMDGSLMSYNESSIHNTHDGVFNEVVETDGRTEIIAPNVTSCNKYTGSMPYDYKISFDTTEPKCVQLSQEN